MSSEIVIINESKTPLGEIHAGALRRILLHQSLYEELSSKGVKCKFLFGNDDYDPYDYLPLNFSNDMKQRYCKYLGMQVFKIPSPIGRGSYSDYYFNDFVSFLKDNFNIQPHIYKMSSLYCNGLMDEGIKLILGNLKELDELYYRVTGTKRNFIDNPPLQIICPKCGNVRTTKIRDYDIDKYCFNFICSVSQLKGTRFLGCGFSGTVSPFSGRARLAWKFEWPVRWKLLNIKVEGCRKDLSTRKGAREFSEKAFKYLYKKDPPAKLIYDYCYIGKNHPLRINRFGVSVKNVMRYFSAGALRYLLQSENNNRVIDISLKSADILKFYCKYLIYLSGSDGDLFFKVVLEAVRYDSIGKIYSLAKDDKFITELELVKDKLRYCFKNDNEHTKDNWFVVMIASCPLSIEEQEFLRNFSKILQSLSRWEKKDIQFAFNQAINNTKIGVKSASELLYGLLIRRAFGPRIGILLENIRKAKLLNYFTKLYESNS